MRDTNVAARSVQRQALAMNQLEQLPAGAQPSASSGPSASSAAVAGGVSAFPAGAGPQPTAGGPQKRKASPTQRGLPPPGERTGAPPLQPSAGSAPG
eukprot:10232766-Alexandrium_andersonii.AAC.1